HISPNWEDTEETKQAANLKVGIDFFLKPNANSLLIVITNLGNLRVLELSDAVSNTQVEILSDLAGIGKLDNIEDLHEKLWESFSVSTVNNSFYSGIADLFDELISYMSLKRDKENVKVFSMRLIGRILFIWFLRKKGFINDHDQYYFSPDKYANSTDYYQYQLKKLFFHTLNTEIDKRDSDKITPYLNGGLFEAHENDWYSEIIEFPESYFQRLYDHLNKYNFTTDESTNEYQQVAIDPEMLGRVFESLLATQITETGETARKAKGAFYTPREIVSYMCKESLREYLYNSFTNDNEKKAINMLLDTSDFDVEQADTNFKRDLLIVGGDNVDAKIINSLCKLKILDPACGSGAFPMGMMQLLVKTHERLVGKKFDTHDQKIEILKNNIFGIDIEPMAVEISRLRAWLSVIVDETNINKVKPLPNLDFKFVCANSIVPMLQEITMDDLVIEETLHEIRDNYFTETNHSKKLEIQKLYEDTIHNSRDSGGTKVKQMRSFDPFKNRRAATFFNKYYMFGVKQGFDIVIGNPPYIGEAGHKELFDIVRPTSFGKKYYLGKMDYFYFFFHLGIELLEENGILTFITTNYYSTADGARKLRSVLYNETSIIQLINFNEITIFESARGQHDMITILRKNRYIDNQTHQIFATDKMTLSGQELNNLLIGKSQYCTAIWIDKKKLFTNRDTGDFYIRFASSTSNIETIIQKLSEIKINLKSLTYINQGVITGADVFSDAHKKKYPLISAKKGDGIFIYPKGELIKLGVPEKLVKPFFKTSDVKKWYTTSNNQLEIIYLDGIVEPNSEFLKYMSKFKDILSSRREFVDGKKPWYQLWWPRNEIMFNSEKIVVRSITKTNDFAYNDIPWFSNGGSQGGVFYITKKNLDIDLKYLLGILNSKLMYLWLYKRGKRKGENLAMSGTPLEQIPIVVGNELQQSMMISFVDRIIDNPTISKADLKKIEIEIDTLVYQIYALSDDEVSVINKFWNDKHTQ
ncbi:MAG: TaqI-like C-terminal specificity domain-containing protein, partial [Acholeplasma sp.]|nr:TaqI-like C-terminal specificity domain-containing protein [Acholeplasma sp.]